MSKPILVANWKNYPSSLSLAQKLLKDLSKKKLLYKKVSFFIAPPLPYMESAALKAKSFSQLASQNISVIEGETRTGEVTPEILKSFGVKLAILGHSERRALGETAAELAQKIKVALRAGIAPLVCIGEKARDTDGEHFELLRQELKLILGGLSKKEVGKLALVYEPVWAIGKSSKDAIEPRELSQTVMFMRKVLTDLFGRDAAEKVPILYGGSVEPNNAMELMKDGGVRGFLVGHASLKAKSMEAIALSITAK